MKFSFGQNWQSFSKNSLNEELVAQARQAFTALTAGIDLKGKRFLDAGFGQGLALFLAQETGAKVFGIDTDPLCRNALEETHRFFPSLDLPQTQIASILDNNFVDSQRALGTYDIVHSWGVLHHTGNMNQAIRNSCMLLKDEGYFVCSIYNHHWSSPIWKVVKYIYNKSPKLFQRLLLYCFYPVIYAAKWMVTREDPKKKERGMDFFHDVVDWIGGYPYEYANPEEIKNIVCQLGFQVVLVRSAQVPTGCNEFIFRKSVKSEKQGTSMDS